MRILIAVIYLISIEIILFIIAKISVNRVEKRIKHIPYYRLQEKIRDKNRVFIALLGSLAIYAPVFSVLLETIGKTPKEPLINAAYLALGITVVVAVIFLCAYRYYDKVVLPKEREELAIKLRNLLTGKIVIKKS